MPVDEGTRKALDLKGLALPPGIQVLRVEAEDYTDSTGEPSLRVLVVLDESVDVENLAGRDVGDFKSAIRERLRKHGITVFPCIFFAKPSELANADEE